MRRHTATTTHDRRPIDSRHGDFSFGVDINSCGIDNADDIQRSSARHSLASLA